MREARKGRMLPIALALALIACGAAAAPERETLYYGIEIDDVVCGYVTMQVTPIQEDGKESLLVEQKLFAMLSALGSQFNSEGTIVFHVDPARLRYSYHSSTIDQGEQHIHTEVRVHGNTVHFTSSLGGVDRTVEIGPDVILDSPYGSPHLVRDFVGTDTEEKTYRTFDLRDGEVHENTVTRVGAETLELAGAAIDTVILDQVDRQTGLKMRLWIDPETGRAAQLTLAGRRIFLADARVVKEVRVGKLDTTFMSPTNVRILDVHGIEWMKVRAVVEPAGLPVTPEGLNVPGQTFEGTVDQNRVEGVFEISHPRYDGSDAPPFPGDFGADPALADYLKPDRLIESDDPVLAHKARELTEGAKDSWEAAVRLGTWVAENIGYEIPGGGTARKTYDLRAGECGAHSALHVALCRAVGIPARVVWGCMYVPDRGGAFGQHGWSEVYMGEAGWIPVDTTAMEPDFVDSGHVRIGELASLTTALNPIEMEILDYRVAGAGDTEAQAAAERKYAEYVGEYRHPGVPKPMTVVVQDGSLGIDIPDRVVLLLDEADENGRWRAKLAPTVYCRFGRDEAGRVDELEIHQLVRMRRTADPESVGDEVPEAMRPLLGDYLLAPLQATFTVIWRDGRLVVQDPLAKTDIGLQPPDAEGRFVDEFDKNSLSFERDDEGDVIALLLDSVNRFRR